ncbi:DUF2306 domain-containing protein [Paenibacillus sp. OAS669]|uniref:DUF2306 domain-containing protein n=1 Tax=Paenibacillus sp. OAS669 TaxID=2663821 RepID=UPI00178B5FED|nr:DUF2306 domain-containing protein [Paenibacillus sp. OAS669]MBE1441734.1 uncharacterized membrane protein HdeD (DUF308 family) [Paenibacillus sp. OAS669]
MNTYGLILTLHIVAGTICLTTGAISAFAQKRKGLHTTVGELYHACYVVILLSSVIMAIMHWAESAYLFYIAIFSYGLAYYGYIAKKRRRPGWIGQHIGGMLGSYIGIITAVLVVNGHHIPVLNQLPILAIWFLPTIIGTPLIVMVGRRYKRRTKA